GGGYVEGVPWLAWVHDANQGYDDNGTAGNVADDKVKKNGGLSPDSGGIGWSYIINNKLASVIMGDTSKGTINFALSESKDTTTTDLDDYSQNINPSEFKLEQNYPNPFNPETIINYQLPINSFVTIKIFDLNGREVKVLVNEYKNAGIYEVKFQGQRLASGVYFYRMEVGNLHITKKAILLR
ncbi:MAG: T9SS type A sorting domain-containing protein, partial [Melioribacteraceae bacterium]|nr:T9SS type A sorting domain-containing protein [Melioribacteraceae bacterium]